MNISVVIITYNEEKNIRRCLESVLGWVNEIIIIDSKSSDKTISICKEYNCKIYFKEFDSYSKLKNFGISKANGDWILNLDADEEISVPLKLEIRKVIKNTIYDGFFIPRISYFMDRWVKYSFDKDYNLRLFRKGKGKFNENRLVHEFVDLKGKVGYLKNPIRHYIYKDISGYIQKMDKYSTLAALQEKDTKKTSVLRMIFSPAFTFVKKYIFKKAFLDGIAGLIVSLMSALYTFLKHFKLLKLKNEEKLYKIDSKVLVIKLRGIGDTVILTPLFKNLKKSLKKGNISSVVPSESVEVLKENPYIHKVFPYKKGIINFLKLLIDLKKEKFDIAICPQASFRSAFLCYLSGAKIRVVNNHNGKNYFSNVIVKKPEEYEDGIQRDLDCLRALRIPVRYSNVEVFLDKEEVRSIDLMLRDLGIGRKDTLVGFATSASRENKIWFKERFAIVADEIIKRFNAKAVFFTDPYSPKQVEDILKLMKNKPIVIRKTNLRSIIGIISRLKLFIGNDTGLSHIAVGLNIPSITIIGPEEARITHPYSATENHYVLSKDLPCKPCWKKECEIPLCLDLITVDDVIDIFERWRMCNERGNYRSKRYSKSL